MGTSARPWLAGSVPAWLGQLPTLDTLRLSDNGLSGPLSTWLGDDHQLIDLEVLALGGNTVGPGG